MKCAATRNGENMHCSTCGQTWAYHDDAVAWRPNECEVWFAEVAPASIVDSETTTDGVDLITTLKNEIKSLTEQRDRLYPGDTAYFRILDLLANRTGTEWSLAMIERHLKATVLENTSPRGEVRDLVMSPEQAVTFANPTPPSMAQRYYEMLRECEVEFRARGAKGIAETIEKLLSHPAATPTPPATSRDAVEAMRWTDEAEHAAWRAFHKAGTKQGMRDAYAAARAALASADTRQGDGAAITDEMVERACVAAFAEVPVKGDLIWNRMLAALRAALTPSADQEGK